MAGQESLSPLSDSWSSYSSVQDAPSSASRVAEPGSGERRSPADLESQSHSQERERATGIEPRTSSLGSWHTYRLRKQMAKAVLVVPHVLAALADSALFVVITR